CNENCAEVLMNIVTEKTKQIFLAHISDEANTRQKALKVNTEALMKKKNLNKDLVIIASDQFVMVQGGEGNEKVSHSSHCCALGLE
ncbi:MAG: MBL fold metallo-hydrolase, partial [Anaerorhabdus sp.]